MSRSGLLRGDYSGDRLLRVGLLGDGLLRGGLSRYDLLRSMLLRSDLSRDGVLRGGLLRGVLLSCKKSRFTGLDSSHIGHVPVPGSGFLFSIADGPLTKILYGNLMVKAVLLPRVDRVARNLDETMIYAVKSVIREGRA